MISPYISGMPLSHHSGYDFNELLLSTEVALLLVEAFGDDAEDRLSLFTHCGRPSDQTRWANVQDALSLYRTMHPNHVIY